MHTFNAIISYIAEKLQFFLCNFIIFIDNQTRMITLKLVLNQNRVLLSFKHVLTQIGHIQNLHLQIFCRLAVNHYKSSHLFLITKQVTYFNAITH